MTKIKKALLMLAAIIGTLLIIYSGTYFWMSKHPIPEEKYLETNSSDHPTLPFFTEIYPSQLFWVDDKNLVVLDKNEILNFDIEERSSELIFTIPNPNTAEDETQNQIHYFNDKILISARDPKGSTTQNWIIDGKEKLELDTIEGEFFALGGEFICATSIREIQEPIQTATTIDIYRIVELQKQQNDPTPTKTLKTTNSIAPMNCSDPLILTPAYQLLAFELYTWDFNTTGPKLIPSLSTPKKEVLDYSYKRSHRLLATVDLDNTVEIYEVPTTNDEPTATATFEANKPWDLIDSASIAIIETENGSELHHKVKKLHNNTQNDTFKATTLVEFDLAVEFLSISISPNQKTAALIASDGELWILDLE